MAGTTQGQLRVPVGVGARTDHDCLILSMLVLKMLGLFVRPCACICILSTQPGQHLGFRSRQALRHSRHNSSGVFVLIECVCEVSERHSSAEPKSTGNVPANQGGCWQLEPASCSGMP